MNWSWDSAGISSWLLECVRISSSGCVRVLGYFLWEYLIVWRYVFLGSIWLGWNNIFLGIFYTELVRSWEIFLGQCTCALCMLGHPLQDVWMFIEISSLEVCNVQCTMCNVQCACNGFWSEWASKNIFKLFWAV